MTRQRTVGAAVAMGGVLLGIIGGAVAILALMSISAEADPAAPLHLDDPVLLRLALVAGCSLALIGVTGFAVGLAADRVENERVRGSSRI